MVMDCCETMIWSLVVSGMGTLASFVALFKYSVDSKKEFVKQKRMLFLPKRDGILINDGYEDLFLGGYDIQPLIHDDHDISPHIHRIHNPHIHKKVNHDKSINILTRDDSNYDLPVVSDAPTKSKSNNVPSLKDNQIDMYIKYSRIKKDNRNIVNWEVVETPYNYRFTYHVTLELLQHYLGKILSPEYYDDNDDDMKQNTEEDVIPIIENKLDAEAMAAWICATWNDHLFDKTSIPANEHVPVVVVELSNAIIVRLVFDLEDKLSSMAYDTPKRVRIKDMNTIIKVDEIKMTHIPDNENVNSETPMVSVFTNVNLDEEIQEIQFNLVND